MRFWHLDSSSSSSGYSSSPVSKGKVTGFFATAIWILTVSSAVIGCVSPEFVNADSSPATSPSGVSAIIWCSESSAGSDSEL